MSSAPPSKLDRFAELLSQELPIGVIEQRLGMKPRAGYTYLRRIRDRLGPQAQ